MADERPVSDNRYLPVYILMFGIAFAWVFFPLSMILGQFIPGLGAMFVWYLLILMVTAFIMGAMVRLGIWKKFFPPPAHEPLPEIAPGDGQKKKSVWISLVLSLVCPGAGQYYCGQLMRGIAVMACTALGLILWFIPGLIVWAIGIADAVRCARNVNDGVSPYTEINPLMLAAAILATIALLVFCVAAGILVVFGKAGVVMIGNALGMPS